MFYLKEFFKSLGESFFRGFSFFFFSCLLAFTLTHRPWVASTVEKISPEKIVNPYFVAVMDENVDAAKLKNLVGRLPGVLSIQDKDQEESRGKLGQLLSQLGSDYQLSNDLMNFRTVRISLNPSGFYGLCVQAADETAPHAAFKRTQRLAEEMDRISQPIFQ